MGHAIKKAWITEYQPWFFYFLAVPGVEPGASGMLKLVPL